MYFILMFVWHCTQERLSSAMKRARYCFYVVQRYYYYFFFFFFFFFSIFVFGVRAREVGGGHRAL